jgi:hypothetical protein
MAVRAHFAIVDLIVHLTDGAGLSGDKREEWKKAQLKIYSHFILTCDDRAATTLLSVDASKEAVGWITFQTLRNWYGDVKDQQLSKLVKRFHLRKQLPDEAAADYLTDMRAKVAEIEKVAENDAQKIWRIIKNTTLVQNLKDTDGGTLTKKLVTNRMAEAEAESKPLSYAQVEGIIENDTDGEVPKPSQPKKPDKDEPDLAMFTKGGRGGGGGRKPP